MLNPASNFNAKTSTLDTTTNLREIMNYIKKFELPLSVAQHIDFQLICNDTHIDNPIIVLDIKLNSYVFHYLESYQLR